MVTSTRVDKRVHHRHADAVQAAGEVVVLAGEFAARVQAGEDQLDARDAFFRMDIHRHAAAVVGDFYRAVGMDDHFDRLRMAGERLVDRVVDDFLRQMVRARGVGVHARAALDGVKARKDFNVGGVVATAHAEAKASVKGWRGRMGGGLNEVKSALPIPCV